MKNAKQVGRTQEQSDAVPASPTSHHETNCSGGSALDPAIILTTLLALSLIHISEPTRPY